MINPQCCRKIRNYLIGNNYMYSCSFKSNTQPSCASKKFNRSKMCFILHMDSSYCSLEKS